MKKRMLVLAAVAVYGMLSLMFIFNGWEDKETFTNKALNEVVDARGSTLEQYDIKNFEVLVCDYRKDFSPEDCPSPDTYIKTNIGKIKIEHKMVNLGNSNALVPMDGPINGVEATLSHTGWIVEAPIEVKNVEQTQVISIVNSMLDRLIQTLEHEQKIKNSWASE